VTQHEQEQTRDHSDDHQKDGHQKADHGMRDLAATLERHYTLPAPETAEPLPRPFPAALWYGTAAGLIAGAALGLLFGRLLFNGTIAPPGWEGIFSLGPFTFHFFWTMWGAALGLVFGGVGTLLMVKPQPYDPDAS